MSIASGLMSRLRSLAHSRRADAELDDEILFHIELETEQNLRAGLSAADARRLAVAKFGGVQRVREDHRDVRRLRWIEDLGGDVRFALRVMRRTPALTFAMVATVALAVGADISVFSAFEAVLIRPLPFPGADRMLMVTEENPERHWHLSLAAMANYFDWRDGVPAFEQMTEYDYGPTAATLTTASGSRRLRAWDVDGSFFTTLGVRTELGRSLRDDETWDSAPATVVLSHAAWIREFGGAPSVIGRTITLDTKPVRVVGVMPATFAFPDDKIDLWQSFRFSASDRSKPMWRDTHWLNVIARLRRGVSKDQAATQLGQVATRLQREYPATNHDMGVSVTPLQRSLTAAVRLPLQLLFAAVTVLLIIACANVGNLMLVQAVGRRHEVALRLALGAERGRLARQALAESLMLTTIGVALGLLPGWVGTHSLVALQPEGLLRVRDIGIDRIVCLYAAVLAAATGLVLGAAPAVWARTRAPTEALNDRAQGGAQGHGIRRWTDLLVIGEVALALTIAASAGLFARSFWHLIRVDPGFDARGVLTASVAVGPLGGSEERLLGFDDALLARARALPGVTNAAMAGVVPLSAYADYAVRTDFIAEGRPANEFGVELALLYVSPSYFQTMRIPLRRGRVFGPSDGPNAPHVVIINEALARTYFAGRDPIGQRLIFQRAPTDSALRYTIIGVAADVHDVSLDRDQRITVYESFEQSPLSGYNILLRTTGDPVALAAPLRSALRDLSANATLSGVRTVDSLRDRALARPRFFAALLLLFAVTGVMLAVVGVYGVLAQLARNRSREIAIRIALGAQAAHVRWLVINHGLKLLTLGLIAGAGVALIGTRLAKTLLYGVSPTDPTTFAAVLLLIIATGLTAAAIPALRASREDPSMALRSD